MQNLDKPTFSEKKSEQIKALIAETDAIIHSALMMEDQYEKELQKVHPKYQLSARNLIHYRAMRNHNLKNLQKGLRNLGLSRLARIQSHVLKSLYTNRALLESFLGKPFSKPRTGISIKKGNRLLKSNAKMLLGYRSKGRRTRIMVTLPSEAANNYQMVQEMIANGMNCARINCAHDDKAAWAKMIENVRTASKKLNKNCKVAMDLAGPKIRTGALKPGPKVRKFRPAKDTLGKIIEPIKILITDSASIDFDYPIIPVSTTDLEKITIGDQLYFRDTRSKKRTLEIIETHPKGLIALCPKTTYLETGIQLYFQKNLEQYAITVGDIHAIEIPIILKTADVLNITRSPKPGENASYDEAGNLTAPAHISCTAPAVFDDVNINDPILFDDGKIEGIIKTIHKEYIAVEISNTPINGAKLRADKGINFPSSLLSISGLTSKDITDLEFVARHADVINLSFANSPEDVRKLFRELQKTETKEALGIILKIETQRGFNQLTEILLEAMQNYPVGVMIARGDLAVESGWKNIGRVQDEILSICQAAHVTDIWATQVLENLSKKGIPSRAEITDAGKAQQADCVMLNKGPYINESIKLLDTLLKELEPYREKNISFLPALSKANSKDAQEK